jgi:hypothetical protein
MVVELVLSRPDLTPPELTPPEVEPPEPARMLVLIFILLSCAFRARVLRRLPAGQIAISKRCARSSTNARYRGTRVKSDGNPTVFLEDKK